LLTLWTFTIRRVEFPVHTGRNFTIQTSGLLTLAGIRSLQGDEFSVELLSLLGIVGESGSIQGWCASSDGYSVDSEDKE
jgi:hypothetical protein